MPAPNVTPPAGQGPGRAEGRARLLAGVIGVLAFLANRDWQAGPDPDLEKMAASFDAYADQVVSALTGRWTPGGASSPTG